MVKKRVTKTFVIDKTISDIYSRVCKDKGIEMSRRIEKFMANDIEIVNQIEQIKMSKRGYKQTKEHRKKITITRKKNGWNKNSEETKKKMRENHKGMLGKNHTKESKEKMSEASKGKKKSEKHRNNISKALLGKKLSEKTRKNMSKNHSQYWLGKKRSKEDKKKMRIAAIKRIFKLGGGPNIGKNETQILDNLGRKINYKIIRQYSVCGYFVDGYVKELNLVIEIDERSKTNERDIRREKEIKEELNCRFLRIKDY